jgi:hypothetical protein
MCLISAIIFAFAIKNAEKYPEDLEEEENRKIKELFDEYKKRQEK